MSSLHLTFAGLATLCASFCWGPPAAAQVPVDLELVLAIDASGSVDTSEFFLQLRGMADALQDPDVAAAITATDGVAVSLVQWSGPIHQIQAVDWAVLTDPESAAAYGLRIVTARRQMFGEGTAIADAMRFAAQLIESNAFSGRRRVIDVSGDGKTNFGRPPGYVRDQLVAAGITINGLAILNEDPELDRYYDEHVIGGAGAFVMTAAEYVDFARAMRRKLLNEILGGPFVEHRSEINLAAVR